MSVLDVWSPTAAPHAAASPAATASASSGAADGNHPRPDFTPSAAIPTQAGLQGIRYDFNRGARVALSK